MKLYICDKVDTPECVERILDFIGSQSTPHCLHAMPHVEEGDCAHTKGECPAFDEDFNKTGEDTWCLCIPVDELF